MRRAALVLLAVFGVAGCACFVAMAAATSPAERAVDGAMVLVVIAAAYGVVLVIWPKAAP